MITCRKRFLGPCNWRTKPSTEGTGNSNANEASKRAAVNTATVMDLMIFEQKI